MLAWTGTCVRKRLQHTRAAGAQVSKLDGAGPGPLLVCSQYGMIGQLNSTRPCLPSQGKGLPVCNTGGQAAK